MPAYWSARGESWSEKSGCRPGVSKRSPGASRDEHRALEMSPGGAARAPALFSSPSSKDPPRRRPVGTIRGASIDQVDVDCTDGPRDERGRVSRPSPLHGRPSSAPPRALGATTVHSRGFLLVAAPRRLAPHPPRWCCIRRLEDGSQRRSAKGLPRRRRRHRRCGRREGWCRETASGRRRGVIACGVIPNGVDACGIVTVDGCHEIPPRGRVARARIFDASIVPST